jgi:hypothetical protein
MKDEEQNGKSSGSRQIIIIRQLNRMTRHVGRIHDTEYSDIDIE